MNKLSSHTDNILPFVLLLIVMVTIVFGRITETQPVIPDSIGYVFAGQQLAQGNGLQYSNQYNREVSSFFYPHSFRRTGQHIDNAFFGYPPGFPLLIASFIKLSQQDVGAYYVTPFLAGVGLLATFWLGCLVSGNKWVGLWAAVVIACVELYWTLGTAPWSEVPSLAFITSGICFFVLSSMERQSRIRSIEFAFLAGLLIGFSFFIRYTNAVLVMPSLVLYALYVKRTAVYRDAAQWAFWGTTTFFLVGVLLFNWFNYGGVLYSIYNTPSLGAYPWSMFSLSYAFGASPVNGYSFSRIMQNLWENFSILLLLVPVGLVFMKRPFILLTSGIVLTTISLYSIYAFAAEGINSRFILPAYPFLAVIISLGIITIGQKLPASIWKWLPSGLLLVWLFLPIPNRIQEIKDRNLANSNQISYAHHIIEQLPSDAVLMSSPLNDLFIMYENKPVLNYRRMWQGDPNTGQFDSPRFKSCLVHSIDKLLEKDVPVYFVEDNGWGVNKTMLNYYMMTSVLPEDKVVNVTLPEDMTARTELVNCNWLK